ncbi:hypothetical protein ES703_44103 [subsurface metagenome]
MMARTLCPTLLMVILLAVNGMNAVAQGQNSQKNYESAVQYLTEDGILTADEINTMADEKGPESVLRYAREHGWQSGGTGQKANKFEVNADAVASIVLDALTADPTAQEIKAVWESFPKEFKADRFELIGAPVYLAENVIGHNFSHYSEGLKIYGYLYKPNGDGPYPLIIMNHGGFGIGPLRPPKETSANVQAGDPRPFLVWCRDLAKEGYVVMASSYRGTRTDAGMSGGGQEGGRGEVTDVLNMLACAKTLSYVDKTRIGMVGTSHGGWITALAVQRTKDITAAIPFFPPGNLFFSEKAPLGGVRTRVQSLMKGEVLGPGAIGIVDKAVFLPLLQGKATLAETRAEMIARTIHLFAENTNAPLFIICGDNDELYPDSVLLYETLKKHGKETWFKSYPGEGHGLTYRGSPEAIDGSFKDTVEFFGKRLK